MTKRFIELKIVINEELYDSLEKIAEIDDCSVKELVVNMLKSYTSNNATVSLEEVMDKYGILEKYEKDN